MRKNGILNPKIQSAIASIGHTEYLVIGDCGLPMPKEAEILDITLVKGIPTFMQVLEAVKDELVVESYIYASEAEEANPEFVKRIMEILPDLERKKVSHEEFKQLTKKAKTIIRTGEDSPYANIILVGGVDF